MAEADIVPAYRTLCSHYARGCSLLAPCCGKVYPCRVCHDDAEDHKMDRKQVKTIQCRNCNELQEVDNRCTKCSIVFAYAYFCKQCRLFDDQDKKQYHCDDCTICRVGGRENHFHCSKCNLCWVKSLRDSHKCKGNATHSSCPVCMEEIHNARDGAILLPCSHYLHHSCYVGLLENGLYKCPLCNTSMIDMKEHWQRMDEERKEWSMPRRYRNFRVQVLCQDCHKTTKTRFHVVGLKCGSCGSYNTSRSGNEEIPAESAEDEEDIEEDSDGGYGYNEDDRVRLALLRQRLGAIIRQWEQSEGEGSNDDDIDSERNHQQQQNMFHSFVNQLQLFQGMLDEYSGRYDDTESEDTESDGYLEESSTHSEGSDEDGDNDDRDRNEESDVAIVDSNSDDDDPDADDEEDSSNPSSPSYSYFSQPHPINLNDIYGSADCESNGEGADSNGSWETEEEEEIIGEVGGHTINNNNMVNVYNAQRQTNDIAGLSGSLGSVTLECQSDTDDSENDYNGLPIIPPCWDTGDNPNGVTSVIFPFDNNTNINALRFVRSSHDYGSSSEEESNVNCNVQ